MKKKLLGISLLTASMLVTACGNTATEVTPDTTDNNAEDVIDIVATSFHEYDWMTQIIGDNSENFNLSLLINSGADLHSYEPTVNDMTTITSSDLFIYNGGESDTWAEEIIEANPDLNYVKVMDVLADIVKDEVIVEGMEHSHEHEYEASEEHDHEHEDEASEEHNHEHDDEASEEHDHEHEEGEEHEHEHEQDEHIWLSLHNAMTVCEHFAEELGELDSANADTYTANAASYIESLKALDTKYSEMVEAAPRDTVIVTDRFPFLYLASDYDINYYAAFAGCSAETEASFETVAFLAEKINEYNANYVIIIENGLDELASTVITSSSNPDVEELTLNSMQSTTQEDIDGGTTYYSIMESNLDVLTQALSE